MSELFKDIPEFVETHIGESLTARTDTLASFRELGPPDLCHVLKTSGSKAAPKELGSYHYLSGVEASSSASLAAYINSLQFHIEDPQAWFATKGSLWHVGGGTYCCFNAFSRVDMRVDVRIPGGVEGYVIDLRGERHPPTPQLWLETFLSALLRAINYADDSSYRLAGFRKLDPITTPEAERRFLEVAEQLFEQGWQLGSDPEIQVATITTNHLTNGIIKYFKDSGRLDVARRFFERVIAKAEKNGQPESMANIGEVRALVARCCIGMNAEIDAVKILHSAIRANPLSYPLLHAQTDFLLSKNRADWARAVAQQAVNAAPSEFVTWAKLTECHIALGDYESALLTLNSCPMFTFNERDLHRMPPPARTHLPVKKYIAESGILDEESSRDTEADVTLLRLPAPGLRGTFAKAYELLTVLVGKIGWDELLRRRSRVFVMEEEYRAHKRGETVDLGKAAEAAAAAARAKKGQDDDSDTASTRGLRESSDPPTTAKSDIPTIRISTESARTPVNGTPDDGSSNGMPQEEREAAEVEKPAAAHAAAEDGVDATAAETGGVSPATTTDVNGTNGNGSSQANGEVQGDQAVSAFSNKRLCERWLDNLFLVLYEDLRVYTIWRAEISYFKTQHRSYRKTGTEWEILGELALRLHHKDEAKDAFQRCLETKFSAKALIKLLETYATEGDLQKSLNTAIKLTTYHHRWYMDSAYPSLVASWIYKLGLEHGHAKIQYTLLSMNLPVGVFEIMQGYLKYASTFNVEGSGF